MPYYIDELKPGMSESFSRTVSEEDVRLFGGISGDTNPMHFDEAFARTTMFGGRIAHGLLSLAYVSTILGMKLPGPGTIFMSLSTRFRAPVRIGDTVVATCTVREIIPEKRRVILDFGCKVKDATVLEGEAMVLPPERPETP